MREILTCAEIARFAELDAERTQGAWTDYGNDWHNVQRPDGSLIPCGHGPAAQEDTAFIAACSVMVPGLLATTERLRDLLSDAFHLPHAHAEGCLGQWDQDSEGRERYPCICGYQTWEDKVKEILEMSDNA